MEYKDLYQNFLEVEEKLDLFNEKINGFYFWECIRFETWDYILEEKIHSASPHPKIRLNVKNMFEMGIRSFVNFIFKNPLFASHKDILFLGHERRKTQSDGKWWDIYCDPIIKNLNMSYELIENYYLKGHLKPAKTQNIRYLDFFTLISVVKRILRVITINFSKEERILLEKICIEFKAKFELNIDLEKITKRNLLIRKSYLPLFKKYLQKINPKVITIVVSYSPIAEILIKAAKSMDIPIIELQHGVIHTYHVGYSYPGSKRVKRVFPDYLFVFGDFWKDTVSYPISKEKIISVGFPYLEDEIKKFKNVKKKNQIVFISSAGNGKELTKLAVKLNTRNQTKHKIIIKLHPGEYPRWKTLYPWLINTPSIKIIDNEKIPLHLILAESKAQVGITSTVIFEGLNFGLKTYLLDFPGIEIMEFLINNGFAKVIHSIEELEKDLNKIEQKSIEKTDYFFKRNAIKNIIKKINEIINSR